MQPFILRNLTISLADGTPVLSSITASLRGKTGIIGRNGSGKTTLLRCLAGELPPSSGSITRPDTVILVPQNLTLRTNDTLAEAMGVAPPLTALRAVESGSLDPADHALADGNWNLEERALAMLDRIGLRLAGTGEAAGLERPVGTLSGGEATLAALAGAFLRMPAALLLDEPTNNLDAGGREWLSGMVETWKGCLVVVSHDPALLEKMESTGLVRDGGLRLYGCGYSGYLAAAQAERETAERRVVEAEAALRGEQRHFAADQTRAARSAKKGVRAGIRSRFPTAAMHLRRGRAEYSAAKQRRVREARLDRAADDLREAKAAARTDEGIRVELPETTMPKGKTALAVECRGRSFVVQGPERIALAGPNGSGKTTLFRAILGLASLPGVRIRSAIPETGYLAQNLDLADEPTVDEFLLGQMPHLTINEAHAVLARFLLKGERARQRVGSLSGGERLRLALACLLCRRPAPKLLLLDEPTNNLDSQSVGELGGALRAFRGAFVAVSHDAAFLRAIGVRRCWQMKDRALHEDGSPDGAGSATADIV